MGAMKAIYTDIQELQEAAGEDEESFIEHVQAHGWTSPTENEIRSAKASKMLAEMTVEEKTLALRVLSTVGVRIPALDFPIRGAEAMPGEHASAA